MRKTVKWGMNILRIIKFKLIYLGSLNIHIFPIKNIPYIGKNVEIIIKPGGSILIGSGVYIDNYTRLEADENAKLYICENVFINTFCKIISKSLIVINKNTMLGSNVSIYDHDHKIIDYLSNSKEFEVSKCIIGSNVWLCSNVLVTRGVTINSSIIVGANSVITRNIIDKGVYGGIPAKKIK